MIKRHSDYSFLSDDAFQKIANVVNDQTKLVEITQDENRANALRRQLKLEGYDSVIEEHINGLHVLAKPQEKIALKAAKQSEQFKRVANGKYKFTKTASIHQANNPLGIQHYDFDEGTIWKVVKAKDGKEYLVKELDENDQVIRQPHEIGFKSTVLASAHTDSKQLMQLCKILYDNPSEEFLNDLLQSSKDTVAKIVTAKLNNIVDSELQAVCITSPRYQQQVKEKIAMAIQGNMIFNRQQISTFINNESRILKQA